MWLMLTVIQYKLAGDENRKEKMKTRWRYPPITFQQNELMGQGSASIWGWGWTKNKNDQGNSPLATMTVGTCLLVVPRAFVSLLRAEQTTATLFVARWILQ